MLKSAKFLSLLSCSVLTAFGLSACTKPPTMNVVRIGLAGPLTGDSAQFGEMMKKGAQLKLEELNASGGIHGKTVELVFGDDKADPKEAASVAQRFASDPSLVGVVGHFNSTCSKAGRSIYNDNHILQVSPGSTNVTVCEGFPYTFRNIYRDDFQGKSVARYAQSVLKSESIAIFFDNDDYGVGLKDAFKLEAKNLGLNIVAEEAFVRETQDFTPQLTTIREKNPDLLFISGLYTQGALIARQARKLGMNLQMIGADGLLSAELVKLGGADVEGMLLSVPFLEDPNDPRVNTFSQKFTERYQEKPDAWAALSYDALGILGAAASASSWSGEAMREAAAAMKDPASAYQGITGLTYFDEHGDCLKPLVFAQVVNGDFARAPHQLP